MDHLPTAAEAAKTTATAAATVAPSSPPIWKRVLRWPPPLRAVAGPAACPASLCRRGVLQWARRRRRRRMRGDWHAFSSALPTFCSGRLYLLCIVCGFRALMCEKCLLSDVRTRRMKPHCPLPPHLKHDSEGHGSDAKGLPALEAQGPLRSRRFHHCHRSLVAGMVGGPTCAECK